jgi:hypothetical protein
MELTLGILIIGSLYWDNKPHRAGWRDGLTVTKESFVRAPIRYGRMSTKRRNTYTMVFSQDCAAPDRLGQALVLRCKSPIVCPEDLISRAQELWAAEQTDPCCPGPTSASWGCVAALPNPEHKIPPELFRAWEKTVSHKPSYGSLHHAPGEESVVSADGILQIGWPETPDARSLPLDVLLATATDPTLSRECYPTPKQIAHAWNNDDKGNVSYFLKNRECGIHTFQDDVIAACLTDS